VGESSPFRVKSFTIGSSNFLTMKFYITTSIAYTNAPPHIGYALESVQADAIARWSRLKGNSTYFLTGTDEHGGKIVRAAEEAGQSPKEFVDDISGKFVDLKETLDLTWDDFIRTTDQKKHWPGVEALWRKLEEQGDIYEKEYEGLYCVGCEAFLSERDLENGLCPNHKKAPEAVKEKNLFFKLSKYQDQIKEAIESGEMLIEPEGRRNEILSLIKNGLEDVSFSRSREKLSWGIPVPGHDNQTIYVWCDALTNYISAIGYGRDEKEFKKWWPADVHVVGKDILRFHAAIWPGMLLSAGLPLPRRIYVHGFVTTGGEKISKSVSPSPSPSPSPRPPLSRSKSLNNIDPGKLVRRYGSDTLRYYLLREIPSNEDGDFDIERFEERYNADLANGLGNFASRVSTLGEGKDFSDFEVDGEIVARVEEAIADVAKSVDKFRLHEAVARIWVLIQYGDGYVNEHKPWESENQQIIFNLVHLLHAVGRLVEPVVPKASAKIGKAFSMEKGRIVNVRKIENLFPRLEK